MALTRSIPLASLLILTLTLTLTLTSLAAAAAVPPSSNTLQEVCGRTPSPQICLQYLSQMPDSSTADTHSLAELAIRAAAALGASTSTFVKQLLESSTSDSIDFQCLNDCSENYVDAVEHLDDSTGAMESNGYGDVNDFVDAAVAHVLTCEDACKGAALPQKSALNKMNGEFTQLCDVIHAIINLVPK